MSSRAQDLARRRNALVERSSTLRASLVAEAQPLVRKAAALDRAIVLVRRYPVITGLVAGAVALLGSRKLLDLAARALALYGLFRRLRA